MLPRRMAQWGSAGWTFLHCVSFSYPDAPTPQDRYEMYAFLTSVGHVLPCKRCRGHYNTFVQARLAGPSSEALESKDTLTRFLVELHNDVNRRLQRHVMEYDRVRKEYEGGSSRATPAVMIWTLVALATLIVLLLYRRRCQYPQC